MSVPIIFDCDTGIDDALAILYGAAHGAEFKACTITHGNVPVHVGSRNTLTILDRLGLTDVPVHEGSAKPMAQPLMTGEFIHGSDGLGDAGIEPSMRALSGDLGAVEIVRLAREFPGELTLVAIGPLTNVGVALLLEPRLPQLVKKVVVMGGAANTAGNASPVAEANIWHDPEAAQLVIDAPWQVLFVGLEITMKTPLSPAAMARIEQSTDPRAVFALQIMQFYLDVYELVLGFRSCVLHDPLALALALEPDMGTYRTVRAEVDLTRGPSRGQILTDLRGYEPDPTDPSAPGVIDIVTAVDTELFHERFLQALGA